MNEENKNMKIDCSVYLKKINNKKCWENGEIELYIYI
jgi:hypothetical protein